MATILLLEDDRTLSDGICIALSRDGHTVRPAKSLKEGGALYREEKYDLVLLDIGLPDGSGTDFCRQLRKTSSVPVIFLTANDTERDILEGFQLGCDDYLAKPFSVEVLRRRILAVLRRTGGRQADVFRYKELEIDFDSMAVTVAGKEIRLTATEYKLLSFLAQNAGRVITLSGILGRLWDVDGDFIDENTLRVHIRRLCQKIEPDPKTPVYILTVFGIGYIFGERYED